jgi:hypothetical protein
MPLLLLLAAIVFSEIKVRPRDVPEEPSTRVIQSQSEWRDFVEGDPPPVDFATETVVAIFAGQRPTGGFSVKVVAAESRDRNAVVTYRIEKPPPRSMVPQMISHPFVVARLKGRFERVEFKEE